MKQIFWFLILLSGTLYAQVDTTASFDQVEVLATRLTHTHGESGRDIRIIDQQEIRASGARSIDEAILLFGGIEVQTRGVYGAQADFSVRGSTFNQVLVLLDGQSILDPLTGHFNSNMPVGIQEVRKIEIIRGPSASIYGPNAVGGVINIVTDFSQPREMGPRLYGGYGFGDYDLRQWEIGGTIGLGKLKAFGNHHSIKTDGPEHLNDTTSQYVEVKTTSFGLVYLPKPNLTFGVKAGIDRRDFDARYYYTGSSFDRSVEQVDRLWLHVKGNIGLKDGSELDINYSRIQTDDNFLFNPAFPVNEHTMYSDDIRLEWKKSWAHNLTTNFGTQIQNKKIESNDRGDHEELQTAFFAIAEWLPIPQLVLNASARLDHHPIYELEVSPQLSLAYKWKSFHIKAATGRAVRAADFTERFINFGRQDTLSAGRNLGNPNLQAEKSWNSEFGLSWSGSPKWDIGVTYFYRDATDLIDYFVTNSSEIDQPLLIPDTTYLYTRNLGQLTTQGVELYAKYSTKLGENWKLQIGANASIIESSNDEEEVSKYLARHAGLFGSYYTTISWKNIQLNINGNYKMRDEEINENQPTFILEDQYHVVNSKVTLRILRVFHLYFQSNNIFDQKYSDILGVQLPGRWWSAGFRAGF